jgi:hypothetical protein
VSELQELDEQMEEEQEKPKRGRPSSRVNGDYISTTIRIPTQLSKELKRIVFVKQSTQEAEITKALKSHVEATKADQNYRNQLHSLLGD